MHNAYNSAHGSVYRFRRILSIMAILMTGFLHAQDRLPKNIILYIGDGMGVTHVTAAKTEKGELALDRFRITGLVTTHAYGRYITDSAAAATAIATGVKTYNGGISVSPDRTPVETVLEVAESVSMSTGLVATCSVTHATPAAFAAHAVHRGQQALIAEQIASSGVDVLFGGGLGYFIPAGREGSLREDEKDLIEELHETHTILENTADVRSWDGEGSVIGLLALEHPPAADQRDVSLAELTQMAILSLSRNPDGFFLMVEGSQIDWEGHDNNSDGIIRETIDFDEAVGRGLNYAMENEETLVLVTADHETGGYALEQGSVEMKTVLKSDFTTESHTGTMVPLFAYGPSAEQFGGIRDNTFIGKTLIALIRSVHR